ncbi:leucine efflux protein LeuE [Ideonella sp. 4Y16]|uniref:Leucine efflux protein LeuE n=1 Tax=Ideonella alba TaxID=2824118 RepID=A0A940YD09_9BURK|nr:leucine efflux protein LeuE [Ideonella alba]MBQ0932886.1 leucine efflux protein LeuE [Ideonella alba]MBQ0942707.1 leucine efflux protein LeuE [Ideonella alba]
MLGITDLTTYLLGTIAIVLLPGPNSLFVLSVAARRGVRPGYAAACGVFVGDTVLMTLAALGAASLLKAVPALFLVIKVVGASYLAWVGIQLLLGAIRRWRGELPPVDESRLDLSQPFRKALVISLLNPKAILFFVSFFIQFVDPAYPWPALTFLGLGAIAQACSAVYLSVLIFAGMRLAAAFAAHRRTASAAASGVGALFLGFGAKLATASLG